MDRYSMEELIQLGQGRALGGGGCWHGGGRPLVGLGSPRRPFGGGLELRDAGMSVAPALSCLGVSGVGWRCLALAQVSVVGRGLPAVLEEPPPLPAP